MARYLNKPAFSVSFPLEDVLSAIEDTIKSKYWHDFKVADIKLVYVPYWVFNYDAYSESAGETGSKVVSEGESGRSGLNAVTNQLDESIADLYETEPVTVVLKPEAGYQFEVQRPNLRENEAKQLAPLKIAASLGMAKENVIISALEQVYIPVWHAWVTVAEGNYKLQINGVSGEMFGIEEVPERERGWLEVTNETLQELKQPGAWVNYTQQLGSGFIYSLFNNPVADALKYNRKLQIGILAIIVLILLLDYLGII